MPTPHAGRLGVLSATTALLWVLVSGPGFLVHSQTRQLQSAQTEAADPVAVHRSARHNFRVVTVAEGLDHPWSLAWLPSGEMLVTERPGRLRLVRNGTLVPDPIEGFPRVYKERGQGGFMDVVPHPDFATNRLLYLSYGKPNADGSQGTTTVVRGRFEGDRVVDVEEIFESDAWGDNNNHFSGRMIFDRDGYLFLTVGERMVTPALMDEHPAQDLANHLGIIVRLHDDGRVPVRQPLRWPPRCTA